MKKYIIVLAIVAIVIVGAVSMFNGGTNDQQGLKTIRVNEVTRSVFYAPQYVAISQGFFEDEGLAIELTTG